MDWFCFKEIPGHSMQPFSSEQIWAAPLPPLLLSFGNSTGELRRVPQVLLQKSHAHLWPCMCGTVVNCSILLRMPVARCTAKFTSRGRTLQSNQQSGSDSWGFVFQPASLHCQDHRRPLKEQSDASPINDAKSILPISYILSFDAVCCWELFARSQSLPTLVVLYYFQKRFLLGQRRQESLLCCLYTILHPINFCSQSEMVLNL